MEPTDLSLPTRAGRVTPTSIPVKCRVCPSFSHWRGTRSDAVHFSFTSSLRGLTSIPTITRCVSPLDQTGLLYLQDHTRPDAHTCGATQASVAVFVHRCSGGIGRQRGVGRECSGFQCGLYAALDEIMYVVSCVVS